MQNVQRPSVPTCRVGLGSKLYQKLSWSPWIRRPCCFAVLVFSTIDRTGTLLGLLSIDQAESRTGGHLQSSARLSKAAALEGIHGFPNSWEQWHWSVVARVVPGATIFEDWADHSRSPFVRKSAHLQGKIEQVRQGRCIEIGCFS